MKLSNQNMSIHVPHGFRLGGMYTGVKRNPTRFDLTLVVSDIPAVAAGVYTSNLVLRHSGRALDRERTPGNSATFCVPWRSTRASRTRARGSAAWPTRWKWPDWPPRLAVSREPGLHALVMSTGVIGEFLPLEKISAGLKTLSGQLGTDETSLIAAASQDDDDRHRP